MSWQFASLAVLLAALAAGFGWYERGRPSSKVLALVATLAALAALGRVAFAPLPNVKPTTDIVILAGYALGGAPGFAVGAVAALASNLFFGEGPWTPWQMGAWGLCGVLGAGLGALSARRMPRVPLALCCALCGLIFGAIMDFSTWTTYAGEHTLGQYLAISGASLGFNIAHAVGNLVFCLAFGPALVRALLRFRARFEVRWSTAPAATAGVLVAAAVAGLALAAPPRAAASARGSALGYLLRAENRDGGYGAAPGARSSQLYTAWAAIGIAAAGRNPRTVRARGGGTPCGFLAAGARGDVAPGDAERTILGLAACGLSPRRTGGVDLVARVRRAQRADGSIGGQVNLTAFGILALRAAGVPRGDGAVRRAAEFVVRQQNRDGGWNFFRRGHASGADDTAGAIEGLVAAGRSRRRGAVARGARYLRSRQNLDGGFALTPPGPSNAQSTAFAAQGLLAAGIDPGRVSRRGSRSPLGYLSSLTGPGGAVRYSRTSAQTPVWVTAQALAALSRRALPVIG